MTPDKHRRLQELFGQMMDATPDQRPALLLKILREDEEVGHALEALLDAHAGIEKGNDPDEDRTRTMAEPRVSFDEKASFAPGEMLLDRFRIVRFLGRGGMGEVYEADDLHLGRVALKTIRVDLAAKSGMMERFRQEVHLARKATSTNVCRIHDLFILPQGGPRGAAAFLTMELLEGVTLADRIHNQGALPFPEAESTALQLCGGLQAIHDAGIIHRDIKPRNVMLSPRNGVTQAVVMDLGLARESARTDEDMGLTVPGAVVGTLKYMAPEQFEGATATVATDIYSLGVLLYEMVTGKHPFEGSTPLAAAVRRGRRPPSPSSLREKLPRRWNEVIDRCLEFEPARRFRSASELADALRGHEPVRMRRVAAYVAAAVLLAAGATGVTRSWLLTSAVIARAKTIVVLPFENLSGDPANQTLCDGLQETATGMLAHAERLNSSVLVVPSSELRANRVKSIADAGKFHADLALTGSVRKLADSLQLTLNLTDAKTLRQLDTRVLPVGPDEMAGLPQRLLGEIDGLVRSGSAPPSQPGAPGERTSDSAAAKLYTQGLGALQNRQLDEAVDYFQKALKRDPQFTAAAAKLAEACVRQYSKSQDAKWLGQADSILNSSPGNRRTPDLLFAQAMYWQVTGGSDKATPLLRQLLQSEPNNVDYIEMLADTLKATGKNTEAEATYRSATELRPGYGPAYIKLGVFYYRQMHDYARAEQTFLAGIGVAPDIEALHSNLGAVYFDQGRWDDAARELRTSVQIRPYPNGYSNLGTLLFYYQRNYSEAARQFEAAVKLDPKNHAYWGNWGDALWQIPDRREDALKAFEKAHNLASQQIGLNPKDAKLLQSDALYLAKLNQAVEAKTEIEAAIQQAPKDMEVRFYAARVYAVVGDLQRAEAERKAALSQGKNPAELEREPDLKPLYPVGETKERR